MTEPEREDEDDDREGVGDVETAGETTAADTIGGPTDRRPVGEGTEVGVEES